tara:strand:- start:1259 stop:2338 length:1080 start_codon:yes stop_codon:yes gene_type:complete
MIIDMGKDSLIIEPFSKNDYKSLITFLSKYEDKEQNNRLWDGKFFYWWESNPAFSKNISRGWVLKNNTTNEILGFLGNVPTKFNYQGKAITVFNATTWMVDSNYRNQSILLFLKFIKYSKETILFDTTPTKNVEQIIKKLGFQKFQKKLNTKYCIYLKPDELMKEKYPKITFFTYFISKLLILYHTIFFLNNEKPQKVRLVNDKNCSDFDMLWEKTKDIYSNTNIRNSTFIKWFCFNKIENNKLVFGYYKGNELEAYCIFKITGVDNSILNCLDLWGLKLDKAIFKSLCLAIIKYGKENGFTVIVFPYFNDHLKNIYLKSGLIQRCQNERRYYKISKNSSICLKDSKTYLSYINGDTGL